jgi:hypothetical protein
VPVDTAVAAVATFLIAAPLLGVLTLALAVAALRSWPPAAERSSETAVGTADQIVRGSRRRVLP